MTPHRAHPVRHRLVLVGVSVVTTVAIVFGGLLVLGGVLVPATYLEPWSRSYASRFDDPRLQVVAQAVLAPSGHNMQPWTVRLDRTDPAVLTLFADPTRLTPAVDPEARQTMVSQGAFLAYLGVAADHLGLAADTVLFPEGTYDESDLAGSMATVPVARVTLHRDADASTNLWPSLFVSDTNRAPYASTAVTSEQAEQVTDLGHGTGVVVSVLDRPDDLAALGDLAIAGTRIETEDAAATAESDRVFSGTEGEKNRTRSGFAVEGQGTTGVMTYLVQGALRVVPALNDDAAAAVNAVALTDAAVVATPAWALVSTATNTRTDQVRAGVVYADLSLTARRDGLVVQPLSQVLQEYPAMAGPYADVHRRYAPHGQTIQMLVRLGTPTTEYPVTMRRDPLSLVAP